MYAIRSYYDIVGVQNKCLMPEAHHKLKRDLILNLKQDGYTVVMVGDASNDILAMKESDLSVITLQNGNVSKKALEAAQVKIENISEIVNVVKNYMDEKK